MKKYGLIGYPLQHSFSARYFAKKFSDESLEDISYSLFPLDDLNHLETLLAENIDLLGLNVTIPYKEKILDWLDEKDTTVVETGAANTIVIKRSGNKVILKGYNTDIFGFEETMKVFSFNVNDKALILGTGGASKAVAAVFRLNAIGYTFVSRNPSGEKSVAYDDLTVDFLKQYRFVINTTPLGMFPRTETFPSIPYSGISKNHIIIDLVYNPEKTAFLEKAEAQGAVIVNGMKMLVNQAEQSWKIWCESEIT